MFRISAYTTSAGENNGVNEDTFMIHCSPIKFLGKDEAEVYFTAKELPIVAGVFDGAGGEAFGKETSELAARYMLQAPLDMELKDVVHDINHFICERTEHGYSTVSALKILSHSEVTLVNCGDSRIYRLREKEVKTLTRDDSMRYFYEIMYGEEEARRRGFLTEYLGKKSLNLEKGDFILKEGDVYVLVTDGAYNSVLEENWSKFFEEEHRDIIGFLKKIIKYGFVKDNLTAVVIEVLAKERDENETEPDEWESKNKKG